MFLPFIEYSTGTYSYLIFLYDIHNMLCDLDMFTGQSIFYIKCFYFEIPHGSQKTSQQGRHVFNTLQQSLLQYYLLGPVRGLVRGLRPSESLFDLIDSNHKISSVFSILDRYEV